MSSNLLTIIVSGPSGVGKSTLLSFLPKEEFYFSVSHTTRPPRNNEKDGEDYYFVEEKTFLEMIEGGDFLEWVKVHSYYYGTSKGEITKANTLGKHLVFDVEVIGAGKLKSYFGEGAVTIFIAPPDFETLKKRLISRGTESEEKIKERLERARFELSFAGFYDYVVINDDLERAKERLFSIIKAELCKPSKVFAKLKDLF
jgi:guanylate kinase